MLPRAIAACAGSHRFGGRMNMRSMRASICVVAAALAVSAAARADMAPPAQETLDILKKYAPLVYLAQGETFLPSSLEDYFQHMHLECDGKTIGKDVFKVTQRDLPQGQGGTPDNAHCRFGTTDAMS